MRLARVCRQTAAGKPPHELSLPTDSGKVIGLSGVYPETETDEIEAFAEFLRHLVDHYGPHTSRSSLS